MSESDTPRETCETCYGLGRVDAVYVPCPDCELTAARAEIEAITETLKSPIEVELDMIRGKIAIPDRAELHCIAQIKAVTEQRDRLAEALKDATDNCLWRSDSPIPISAEESLRIYNKATEALQSLTTNVQAVAPATLDSASSNDVMAG